MAKKRQSGKHSTPRRPVQLPEDWMDVVRQLAAKHKQPVVWLLIHLAAQEAAKFDIACPKLPWEPAK